MSSPFIYEGPLEPPELLADRRDELALLRDRAGEMRNTRLEGPRRFGKTSLLKAALAQADRDGLVPIYVNFLGVLTPRDVAERVERAYREQLEAPLKRWFAAFVAGLRPQLSAAPGGVGVQVSPQSQTPALLDRLALPRRLQERHGRQCAIAFDEFQDVVRMGAGVAGTIRSELEQHGSAAAYMFSGSHPGLMRDLFSERRHAFFAQAKPLPLPRLDAGDLAEYIGARFDAGGRDPGDALELLLGAANGHPQRAMLLAHHLYERTRRAKPASVEDWTAAYQAAARDADPEVQAAWDAWNNGERKLMAVISNRVMPLQGRDAQRLYGVSQSGGNRRALTQLERDGHIVADAQTRTGWRVVDPMLEQWLANGRSWPAAA